MRTQNSSVRTEQTRAGGPRLRIARHGWLMMAFVVFAMPLTARAQLADNFLVEATNSPEDAGTAISMVVTARTFLDIAIPLYNPGTITITADNEDVVFSNPSGNFALMDNGDGTATVTGAALDAFDANGQFTFDATYTGTGNVLITVTEMTAEGSDTAAWNVGPADHLVFTVHPINSDSGETLTPAVAIRDAFDNVVTDDDRTITLGLGTNPGGTVLNGTASLMSVNGVAQWTAGESLDIKVGGDGYTMTAMHDGAAFTGTDTATSNAFNILVIANGGGDDDPNDMDGDGIPDDIDPYPDDPDANNDGIVDGDQTDTDGDGLPDASDPDPQDPDVDDDGVLDGSDNCVTFPNADQADTDADGVGDVCEDNDGDDIINGIEDMGPNNGDANNDGTPDKDQANVGTFETDGGAYVTLVAPAGTQLRNIRLMDNPSPANSPDAEFPIGFIAFDLTNLPAAGVTVDVELFVSSFVASGFNSFYNFGPLPDETTPHWYMFDFDDASGAQILTDRMTLRIIDGGRGDTGLGANGTISFLGGPAIVTLVLGATAGCGSCGAGVGQAMLVSILGLGLMHFGTFGVWRRRRRAG